MNRHNLKPAAPLIIPGIALLALVLDALFFRSLRPLDETLTHLINHIPRSAEPIMLAITNLGSVPVVIAVASVAALVLVIRHRRTAAVIMAGSLISMPTFFLIKELVHRSRPAARLALQAGLSGFSFPSGHATGSSSVYGALALVLTQGLSRRWRYFVIVLAIILIAAIGVTRVYLGAHYPTDVLGGWLLGFIILSLLRSVSLWRVKHDPGRNLSTDTIESKEGHSGQAQP